MRQSLSLNRFLPFFVSSISIRRFFRLRIDEALALSRFWLDKEINK